MMGEYLQQHSVAPIVLTREDVAPSQKRQEGEHVASDCGGGGGAEAAATAEVGAVTADVVDNSVDEKQFNNFNYWGRPYLDCLHVVDDSA
jgi:hypothetical protein